MAPHRARTCRSRRHTAGTRELTPESRSTIGGVCFPIAQRQETKPQNTAFIKAYRPSRLRPQATRAAFTSRCCLDKSHPKQNREGRKPSFKGPKATASQKSLLTRSRGGAPPLLQGPEPTRVPSKRTRAHVLCALQTRLYKYGQRRGPAAPSLFSALCGGKVAPFDRHFKRLSPLRSFLALVPRFKA